VTTLITLQQESFRVTAGSAAIAATPVSLKSGCTRFISVYFSISYHIETRCWKYFSSFHRHASYL